MRLSNRADGESEALGEQKACHQFLVMARRTHRERETPSAKADFERLFDCESVVLELETPVAKFARRMMRDALG